MSTTPHKAGIVPIIGIPNSGKSTLFNILTQAHLSIATPKAQTTRKQLIGITNTSDAQIVYIDTPGYINPKYLLQKKMVQTIQRTIPGSDLILWVVDAPKKNINLNLIAILEQHQRKVFLIANKIDLIPPESLPELLTFWNEKVKTDKIIPISARYRLHIDELQANILANLPNHPPYYDKNKLTDGTTAFFIEEIVRKAIFLYYKQEIPYTTEVAIQVYQEEKEYIRIETLIYTERLSQKKILIGKKGTALKKVGTAARKELETFLGKKVFLKQHIKILTDWRKKASTLHRLGYT